MKKFFENGLWSPRRDWQTFAILIALSVLIRLPLLRTFDLVSFDGTYYINQAKALWSSTPQPGNFPIGYPFFISLLLPILGDGVRAAQVVSFVAAMGSLVVLYLLAKRMLSKRLAFYSALVLALNPLFIRLSMETFSESTFTFFLLLTLLLFFQGRDVYAGVAGGIAAITRPEILAVVGVLTLLRLRSPRRALLIVLPFVIVYSLNAAVFYRSTGNLTVLPKSEFFGVGSQDWRDREKTLEGPEGETASGQTDGKPNNVVEIAATYAKKLPLDLYILLRNLAFGIMILAVHGALERRTFLLAVFVPLLIGPLFTVRPGTERYLLPYIPILIFYGFVGASTLRHKAKQIAFVVIAACTLASPAVNWGHLTNPVDEGYTEMKEAGLFLRGLANPGDKVGDRKPYVAFYAGIDYVEIPNDRYEGTIQYLLDNGVRYLSLDYDVISHMRPLLKPLLSDAEAIAGELRFRQIYALQEGLILYERVRDDNPLRRRRVTTTPSGLDTAPSFSPDGRQIVFSSTRSGNSDLYVVGVAGGQPRVLVDGPSNDDQPVWSPDGAHVAFTSNRDGNWEIYTFELASGTIRRVTNDPSRDGSAAWSHDSGAIFFASDRSGSAELWRMDLASGELERITDGGGNNFPALSPDGRHLAWTRRSHGLYIRDLQAGGDIRVTAPTDVNYAPTWSPDGRHLAVTAKDWGSVDIYLVNVDGKRRLLLTKNASPDGERAFDAFPAWSPTGNAIAIISNIDGPKSVYVLEGLEPYLDRLDNPLRILTVQGAEPEPE